MSSRATRREKPRRYGQPCRGFWSSHSKDQVAPEVLTGDSTADSYNVLVSSQENHIVRRRGIAYYGESDVTAQAGLLEAVTKNMAMNMTCRHMLDVQYPSATPGSIVGPTALYTDLADTGHFGQLYVNTSTQGTRKVLGHEMGTLASPGTTHYPRSTNNTRPNFRMIPLPYMAGGGGTQATGYNRCTFPLMRALLAGGAMKMYQADSKLFWPSLHGTPGKWDLRSNPSTSTGTEQVHIGPWGHIQPLFPPYVTATTASTGTDDQIWWDGDQFYVSVVYQFDDGSFSMPFAPTAGSGGPPLGTNSNGLITVGSASGHASYKGITLSGIAIGPPGTAARLLCRSRKTNVSTDTTRPTGMTPQGATSDLASGQDVKLYVFAVIRNNTQSQYVAVASNDDALLDDALAIRYDHIWCHPARYAFELERRAGVGYARKQQLPAIIVAPTRSTASHDLNVAEDVTAGADTPYGAYAYCFRIFQSTAGALTVQFRRATIGAGTIVVGTNLSVTATATLSDVLYAINVWLLSGGGTTTGEPAAQLAPGTDGALLASKLAPTVLDVASCTLSTTSTITSSGGFTDVAIGMRIKVQSGTGTIPSNSVVVGKASDSSITIGTEDGASAVTTAGTATLRFWSDTGDDSWSTDTATWDVGNIRTYCGAFPAFMALRGSFVDAAGFGKQDMLISSSAPGKSSLAPQSFFNSQSNRHAAPSEAGIFMGSAPASPGVSITFYSEGIFAFSNVRDFNTGEDQDYHLIRLTPKGLGCIQYGTIAWGTGWAGCLTAEGYLVTDGRQYQIISNPLLDPARRTGILAYQGVTLASFNGSADLPQYQTAHALVVDGTLRLSVKPNAAAS